MIDYIESKMDFSPLFIGDNSIYIEKSQFRLKQCKGVRTVEFITVHAKNKLIFIEAKETAPNPNNPKSKERIVEYYQILSEKIQQSLDMFVSKEVNVNLDVHNEFSKCFNKTKFTDYKLIFMLVIRNHEKKWCSDVVDVLKRKLLALRKIWNMEIVVYTGEEAVQKGFVASIVI